MQSIHSKLIHGQSEIKTHGPMRPPIYQSAAFEFETAELLEESFRGQNKLPAYSRSANPTVSELESRLKILSTARNAICMSSGMAVVNSLVLGLCQQGDNIVVSPYLFGNTVSYFAKTILPFGIEVRFTDFSNLDDIANKVDEKTRLLFLETITNPQLQVVNFDTITKWANERGILTCIDNTLLTSYVFDARQHGFDLEVVSTSKYISGGGTSIGGALLFYETLKYEKNSKIRDYFEKYNQDALFYKLRREVYRNMGCCLSPESAWLQILGLETLSLRADKSMSNAQKVAEALSVNSRIVKVIYPGLPDNEYHNLAKKYFGDKHGCLVTFEMKGKKDCFEMMNKLKMIKRGTNLCDNKSLIIHPQSTIYCEYPDETLQMCGINDRMIRLSVGIEDINDIIDDLLNAIG